MRTRITTTIGLALALAALPAAAPAEEGPAWLYHVPPAEAEAGDGVVFEATVQRGWTSNLEVRYRAIGDAGWRAAPFELVSEDVYKASVPGSAVQPPGFEYYIAGGKGGLLHFASAEDPHQVLVHEDARAVRRRQELTRLKGRQARFRLAGELVNFGTRPDGLDDYYYRVDADFTYRLLRFPLYSLRFGFSQLKGVVPDDSEPDATMDAGFRAGGWFELSFRLAASLHLDGRLQVQATPRGFAVGARSEARLGSETGSHVALGVEGIYDVGGAFWFRLGWDTVPRFPMAATIELTNYPWPDRPWAIRLLYDVSHELSFGLRVGARAGFQARDGEAGGATVGLHTSLDF